MELKAKQVKDAFERIGKVKEGQWFPILPSEKTTYYRNKLEYTFSDSRWLEDIDVDLEARGSMNALGFHIPKRFDKILDIQHCYLQPEPSNAIRLWAKKYAEEKALHFYNQRHQVGFMRNLIIRTTSLGQVMVVVFFSTNKEADIEDFMSALVREFPKVDCIQYIINPKMNTAFNDLEVHHYAGQPFVMEGMEELRFRVGATSFYQTNSDQALALYRLIAQLAKVKETDLVYDLYTGTGTIALFLARKAKHVVGVEYVEAAVIDAQENAKLNGLQNTTFVAGDMAKVLNQEFVRKNGQPQVVITDPPRAGMHPDVVTQIVEMAPDRVVYVSCNPATQARDLALFGDDYQVVEIHPVDMFPHTHHVENVVLLERK